MNKDEYFISFHSYGTMVRATNTDDAIIVAKSNAIQKGYAKPKLVSINFADGSSKYFCRVCGVEEVTIKESICEKCPQELGNKAGKGNSALSPKPTSPQNSHRNSAKPRPQKLMTFVEFLKRYGGKWETMDDHFYFNSLESFSTAEQKLDKMMREGETHIMNIVFADELEENRLNFQMQFISPREKITIWKGKARNEQNFNSMKEAFGFMRSMVHKHFQLIPSST